MTVFRRDCSARRTTGVPPGEPPALHERNHRPAISATERAAFDDLERLRRGGALVDRPGDGERRQAGVPVAILELDDHPYGGFPLADPPAADRHRPVIMAEVHFGDDVVAAGEGGGGGGGVLPQPGVVGGPEPPCAAALLMTTSWLRDTTGPVERRAARRKWSSRARSWGKACSRRRYSIDRARSAMVGKRSSLVSS